MTPYKYCTTCGHTWPEDCGCGKHSRPVMAHSEALDWFESLLTPFDPVDPHCTCDKCIVVRRLRASIAAERGEV